MVVGKSSPLKSGEYFSFLAINNKANNNHTTQGHLSYPFCLIFCSLDIFFDFIQKK